MPIKRAVFVGLIVTTILLMQWLKYNSLPPFSLTSGLAKTQYSISEEFNQRVNRYFDLPLSEEELLQKLEKHSFTVYADENYASLYYQESWGGTLFDYRIAWNEEDGEVTEITGDAGFIP